VKSEGSGIKEQVIKVLSSWSPSVYTKIYGRTSGYRGGERLSTIPVKTGIQWDHTVCWLERKSSNLGKTGSRFASGWC